MKKTRYQRKQEIAIPEKFTPQFWKAIDGRYEVVKVIRQRYEQLKIDANADSSQKDILCQMAVFMRIQLETMECIAAETGKFDPGVYTQMANGLLGLLKSLGLQKQGTKAIDVKGYIKAKSQE